MKTVNEVARLCGISVRTLHYYDQLGLLSPTVLTPAGYRLYDDAALARLQQILFFRELDFPLKEIRDLLDAPSSDPQAALRAQKTLLVMKRDRLNGLIALMEAILKGDHSMHLQKFDATAIETAREQYAEETRSRWGGTAAYQESEKRTSAYLKEDWAETQAEETALFRRFAAVMKGSPAGAEAQALVAEWQRHISSRFYPCTKEILAGLGEMYVRDERFTKNLDQYGAGLAAFMSAAIAAYCR